MTKLNRRPFGILMRRLLLPAICLIALGAAADDNLKPPPEAAFLAGMMKVADNWVLDYQAYEELVLPAMNGEEHPVKRENIGGCGVTWTTPSRVPIAGITSSPAS